jgi:hypothetical protein
MVLSLLAGGSAVQNTVAARDFSPKCPDWLWDPSRLLFNEYLCFFLGVKHPGHEVNHSPPSLAEVKNKCTIPLLPICLQGMDRENFTFIQNALIPAVKD